MGKSPILKTLLFTLGGLGVLGFLAGCRDEPRKQQSYVPYETYGEPKVGPVVALDGQVLDEKTSPQEVTVAALKAVQADFKATAARDAQALNQARKVLYQLSAPQTVMASYLLAIPAKEKDLSKEDAIRAVNGWWTLGIGYYTDDIVYEHYTMTLQIGPNASGVVGVVHEGRNAKTGQPGWIKVSLVKENGFFRVAGMELTQKPPDVSAATQAAATQAVANRPASRPSSGPATSGPAVVPLMNLIPSRAPAPAGPATRPADEANKS